MAFTTQHRTLPLGSVSVSQRTLNDGTDDVPVHAAILVADADAAGCSYHATGAAATNDVVKASAGKIKGVYVAGTGTAGTVAIIDGSTTIFTMGVPAAVTTLSLPIPPEGIQTAGAIKITTTGSGVTALTAYI